jgi:hypothetical protein
MAKTVEAAVNEYRAEFEAVEYVVVVHAMEMEGIAVVCCHPSDSPVMGKRGSGRRWLAAAHGGGQEVPLVDAEALWWPRRRCGERRGATAGGGAFWWETDSLVGRGAVVGAEML